MIEISACFTQRSETWEPDKFFRKFYCEGTTCSDEDGFENKAFLNCTTIIVMLSQPSSPDDGAKHLSNTLSHTAESFFSCKFFNSHVLAFHEIWRKWLWLIWQGLTEFSCCFTKSTACSLDMQSLAKESKKTTEKRIWRQWMFFYSI